VGILDWLTGRKRESTPSDKAQTKPVRAGPQLGSFKSPALAGGRPFDTVAAAQEAWRSGDVARADHLFIEGIDAYKRREQEGLDFALGRYGAFLLDQGRINEAENVLRQAVNLKTDIPAIWSDYIRLLADRRDLEGFKRAIEQMAACVPYRAEPESLLAHARRADRENASAFAEALARFIVERATGEGDQPGRWAAIGDLGRIIERAGRLDEAVTMWREAFAEGSVDPVTLTRLSMHFERSKQYGDAIAVIREALTRGLPANVEESLRKRLAKCEAATAQGRPPKVASRTDVPAFSVRRESGQFEQLFQLRLRPAVRDLELVGGAARCLLVSKQSSMIVDIDVSTARETRRVENLPLFGKMWFAPNGCGVGIRRTAAIGRGPTILRFLDADGRLAAESAVPDATSEIAVGPDLWYIGCRDGCLYSFGFDGKRLWKWETPGASEHCDSEYSRPCPYLVASQASFAAVASMANLYAVSSVGRTLWQQTIPNERQTRWEFTMPVGAEAGSHEAHRILGLRAGASHAETKAAYRRLALETHPDRSPNDTDATTRFREVQGAYERLMAAPVASGVSDGLVLTIEMQIPGPTVSFLAANDQAVVAASSQGRLYLFDAAGQLCQARVLGEGPVSVALRPDGTLGAAWCDNTLLFFKRNSVVNAAQAAGVSRMLTMLGDDVVLWGGKHLHVMDQDGRLLWSVEFSKTLSAVTAHEDVLLCAAGVLAAFRRRT
jgi:tetratricopeptide (TPR) repeat protein